jgi:hypothetical protein
MQMSWEGRKRRVEKRGAGGMGRIRLGPAIDAVAVLRRRGYRRLRWCMCLCDVDDMDHGWPQSCRTIAKVSSLRLGVSWD